MTPPSPTSEFEVSFDDDDYPRLCDSAFTHFSSARGAGAHSRPNWALMYAAHMACGLAIKAAVPKAPTWAVLGAAFLPDFFWLAFSLGGIEPVEAGIFFDGWSHSVLSIITQALAVAFLSRKLGRPVALALGGAVLSHLPLDIPIHPLPLELYPHSPQAIGVFFKTWGLQASWLGKSHYWWVEADVTLLLLALYAVMALRSGFRNNVVIASVILVGWIQVMFG